MTNKEVEKALGATITPGKERLIGDLHFFDKNIIQMAPRDFENVEIMNKFMIDMWNSETDDEDTVIVVGDFFDCSNCTKEEMFHVLDQLKGKIVLIVGNHDYPCLDWYREYGITVIEYPIVKDEFWIISHEPQYVSMAAPYANIFAHVHLNPMYNDVSPRSFCVSAERLGYKPMLLSKIKAAVLQCVKEVNHAE